MTITKIVTSLLLFLTIFSFATVVVSAASNNEDWYLDFSQKLVAGKNTVAGTIDIDLDTNTGLLTVTITTTGDWELVETHIHVADTLDDFPLTKKGNPKIGHFDYTDNPAEIDVSAMSGDIFIAIHAVVRNECTCEEETAWGTWCPGDTAPFPGSNWAVYIVYGLPAGFPLPE